MTVLCTREIATFIGSVGLDDIPTRAQAAYRSLLLDSIACGIAGARTDAGRIVLSTFPGRASRDATVWGTGVSRAAADAAYINGHLCNVLDFDDTFSGAGHPGATVVPTALALAERRGASGSEVMCAMAVGYEVTVRLGLALRGTTASRRYAFGYGHQTLGAAAAGARVEKMGQKMTETALGLAAVHSPVPYARKLNLAPDERPMSWVKNNYGWMALGAVLSCDLASSGFTGPKSVLDGPNGYWRMLGSDRLDHALLLNDLGRTFHSADTEHKPYASCRWTHSAIEATVQLREAGLRARDVVAVEVESFGEAQTLAVSDPADEIDAQFSLPYLVARAIHGLSLTNLARASETEERRVRELASKVKLRENSEFESSFVTTRDRPARVTVSTVKGQSLSKTIRHPKGHPPRHLSWDEVREKSEALVTPTIGGRRARLLTALCSEIESVRDFAEELGRVLRVRRTRLPRHFFLSERSRQ